MKDYIYIAVIITLIVGIFFLATRSLDLDDIASQADMARDSYVQVEAERLRIERARLRFDMEVYVRDNCTKWAFDISDGSITKCERRWGEPYEQ